MEYLLKHDEQVEPTVDSEDLSRAEAWYEEDPPQAHADEAGDDGWQEHPHLNDSHQGDDLPRIDGERPDSSPSEKVEPYDKT